MTTKKEELLKEITEITKLLMVSQSCIANVQLSQELIILSAKLLAESEAEQVREKNENKSNEELAAKLGFR